MLIDVNGAKANAKEAGRRIIVPDNREIPRKTIDVPPLPKSSVMKKDLRRFKWVINPNAQRADR